MKKEPHSISIRVNGKEREIIANEKLKTNPLEDESFIPSPDKIIDFSKLQEQQKQKDQPYWDDGNRAKSPKIPFKRKKKSFYTNGRSSFPYMLVMALFSAIVVGLGLGLTVLTFFTGNDSDTDIEVAVGTDEIPTFSEAGGGLPVLTVAAVQGGAFSTKEKGEEMVTMLQQENLAAVLTTTTDPIYMFIGIGNNKEDAAVISERYKELGQETYVKTYKIDGQVVSGQAEDTVSWFERALYQYNEMLKMTAGSFKDSAAMTNDKIEQLEATGLQLQEERDKAFKTLPEGAQSHALALAESLVAAKDELKQFAATTDEQSLWRAEQTLLQTLTHYEQVINQTK